jgi:hypothetical protein
MEQKQPMGPPESRELHKERLEMTLRDLGLPPKIRSSSLDRLIESLDTLEDLDLPHYRARTSMSDLANWAPLEVVDEQASKSNGSGVLAVNATPLEDVEGISRALVISDPNQSALVVPTGSYVDITPYLNMPQSEAAKKLNIPTSTLSKRWKEAVRGRKWPYRILNKLDKEITTLMYNIPADAKEIPPEIEISLGKLLRQKQEELKSVVIRL